MFTKDGTLSIWRIIIMALFGGLMSIGGWVFTEVRMIPATYQTIEKHDSDHANLRAEQMEQTTRIEEKVDELNTFLRNYFSSRPNNP